MWCVDLSMIHESATKQNHGMAAFVHLSIEQGRQWQCTVVCSRVSQNCPTLGRSNTGNLGITPVQTNEMNKYISASV